MRPKDREYVAYRLSRAGEALQESRLMLETGHFDTAVSRAYYACFYAASALLLTEGQASSRHAGLIALFDQHWVKPDRMARELSRTYHGLFDRRQEGDYGDGVTFEPAEVEEWLRRAEQFVERVSAEARGRLAGE